MCRIALTILGSVLMSGLMFYMVARSGGTAHFVNMLYRAPLCLRNCDIKKLYTQLVDVGHISNRTCEVDDCPTGYDDAPMKHTLEDIYREITCELEGKCAHRVTVSFNQTNSTGSLAAYEGKVVNLTSAEPEVLQLLGNAFSLERKKRSVDDMTWFQDFLADAVRDHNETEAPETTHAPYHQSVLATTTAAPPTTMTTGNHTHNRKRRSIGVSAVTNQAVVMIRVAQVPHPLAVDYTITKHQLGLRSGLVRHVMAALRPLATEVGTGWYAMSTVWMRCNPTWVVPCVITAGKQVRMVPGMEDYLGQTHFVPFRMDHHGPIPHADIQDLLDYGSLGIGDCISATPRGVRRHNCRTGAILAALGDFRRPGNAEKLKTGENTPWGPDYSHHRWDGEFLNNHRPGHGFETIVKTTMIHNILAQWDESVPLEFSVENLLSLESSMVSSRRRRAIIDNADGTQTVVCPGLGVCGVAVTFCKMPNYGKQIKNLEEYMKNSISALQGQFLKNDVELKKAIVENYDSLRQAILDTQVKTDSALRKSHNALKQALEQDRTINAEKFSAVETFITDVVADQDVINQGFVDEVLAVRSEMATLESHVRVTNDRLDRIAQILSSVTAANNFGVKLVFLAGKVNYFSGVFNTVVKSSPFEFPSVPPMPGLPMGDLYFAGVENEEITVMQIHTRPSDRVAHAYQITTLVPGREPGVGPWQVEQSAFVADSSNLYMELDQDTLLAKRNLGNHLPLGVTYLRRPIPHGVVLPNADSIVQFPFSTMSRAVSARAFVASDNERCYASCLHADGCDTSDVEGHTIQKLKVNDVSPDCGISGLIHVRFDNPTKMSIINFKDISPLVTLVSLDRLSPIIKIDQNLTSILETAQKAREGYLAALKSALESKSKPVTGFTEIDYDDVKKGVDPNIDTSKTVITKLTNDPIAQTVDLVFVHITAITFWVFFVAFLATFGFCFARAIRKKLRGTDMRMSRFGKSLMKGRGNYTALLDPEDTIDDKDGETVIVETEDKQYTTTLDNSDPGTPLLQLLNPVTGKMTAIQLAVEAATKLLSNTASGKATSFSVDPKTMAAKIK